MLVGDFVFSIYLTVLSSLYLHFFFFNDTATTEIYTLSLHDALPISPDEPPPAHHDERPGDHVVGDARRRGRDPADRDRPDRKSTRLNSSHANISYAVFCLKKKKNTHNIYYLTNHYY